MKGKLNSSWIVGALALLVVAGCSKSNVPCDTDPAQLANAEAEIQSARSELDSAASQLEQAKATKGDLDAKMRNMPDVAELERRLEELKKGSGR